MFNTIFLVSPLNITHAKHKEILFKQENRAYKSVKSFVAY